jgi:N-acetyl sugar amidotransferase
MDLSDPGLSFDDTGLCNRCHNFRKFVVPLWRPDELSIERFRVTAERIRSDGKGKEFDCLLGLSGGVDSSYLLHIAITEFGLRPLVFHVDGGWNSELAVHNINALVEGLDVDLFTEVIDWHEMRDFQVSWLKAGVPHIDIPQDHAFVATLYRFAEKHGVKYILNGGNYATESVQPPLDFYYYGTDMVHIRDIRQQFGTIPLATYPFSSVYKHKIWLRYIKGLQVVKPLDQIPFSQESAISTLASTYGWRPYPQKHFESNFTRFYEAIWLPERFNFDVRRCQFSSLILSGQMTRSRAIELLASAPLTDSEVQRDFSYVATKLGITEDELSALQAAPLKYYWDYKNQKRQIDLGARAMRILKLEGSIKQ